jgi:ABC-2 type transport system permease protein
MSWPLYVYEVRQRGRSVAQWGVGLLAMHYLYVAFYPVFAEQAAAVQAFLRQLPPEYRTAFGLDGVDLSQVLGYYSMIFLFVQMLLAVQASRYGFDLVAAEERHRTADFLLTRPVSRSQVFGAKLLAALTALGLTWAVTWAAAWSSLALFHAGHPYDRRLLALMLAGMVPFQGFFLAVGAALAVWLPRLRASLPYALGLAFGMYALNAAGDLQGRASPLERLTPFAAFDPSQVVRHGGYEPGAVALMVALSLLALAVAYARFLRRDIPAP